MVENSVTFVGREDELARLDALLRRVLNAQGQVCFVGGEPGAGKTALVHEFTRRAQLDHPELVIAVGDCSATSATSNAYLPFREILGLLTGDVEASVAEGAITAENATRLRKLVGRAGNVVADYGGDLIDVFIPGAALVTKLGRHLAKRLTTGSDRSAGASTVDDPARVLQQFTNVVRKLSEASPIVIVIDDVHWADRASLDLLFHLSRRIEGSRLLVLATYRSNEVTNELGDDRHPLAFVLNEVRRYYGDVIIDLDAETTVDRLAFVNRLIDAEPNDLPASFREDLVRHTDGHPLFTVELIQALRERGVLARNAAGSWQLVGAFKREHLPQRSEGVIGERIGRLPADVRDLLSIAAVEGEQFTAEVVARVANLDRRAVIQSLSNVAERRHHLVHAQGVQKLGAERLATYRFRHELFRSYLYAALDPVECSELHYGVGRALEALHGDGRHAMAPVLADHFERAGESEAAFAYLDVAAESALRRHAPRQAAELWQRALSLRGTTLTPTERLPLLEKRGDALRRAGAFDDATRTLEEAFELATDPLTRSRLLRKIGGCLADQHHLPQAKAYLARAQATLPPAAADAQALALETVQLFLDRAWAAYWLNERMDELLNEGASLVEQHGTTDDRARWAQMQVLARLRSEKYRPSGPTVELAQRQLDAAMDAEATIYAHCAFLHGFVHLWHGDLDTAEQSLLLARHTAQKFAHGLVLVFSDTYLTVLHRLRGDTDAVLAAADAAEAAARECQMAGYIAAAQANRAWARYREGNQEQLEPLAAALEVWLQPNVAYPFRWLAAWPLAAIYLARGRTPDAITALGHVLAPAQQPPPAGIADAVAAAARAMAAHDEVAAAQHVEQALRHAREAGEL